MAAKDVKFPGIDANGKRDPETIPTIPHLEVTLGVQGGSMRKLLAKVVDLAGRAIPGIRLAHVEVIHDPTASALLSGDTQFDAVIAGGASASMHITTDANGELGIGVTDEGATETVIVKITVDGCPPVLKQVAFAAA